MASKTKRKTVTSEQIRIQALPESGFILEIHTGYGDYETVSAHEDLQSLIDTASSFFDWDAREFNLVARS